jgi:hypothetical protein
MMFAYIDDSSNLPSLTQMVYFHVAVSSVAIPSLYVGQHIVTLAKYPIIVTRSPGLFDLVAFASSRLRWRSVLVQMATVSRLVMGCV